MNELALINNYSIRKELSILLAVILLIALTVICLSIIKSIKEK